jgi:LDH2 family malate/lactate/ureidoglycolate dehydrogenase
MQVIALEAMERAIEKTRTHGMCTLAIRAVHHIGRTGTYTEMAARAGFVALCFVNVAGHAPSVAPYGAAEKRLGSE